MRLTIIEQGQGKCKCSGKSWCSHLFSEFQIQIYMKQWFCNPLKMICTSFNLKKRDSTIFLRQRNKLATEKIKIRFRKCTKFNENSFLVSRPHPQSSAGQPSPHNMLSLSCSASGSGSLAVWGEQKHPETGHLCILLAVTLAAVI